MNSLPSPISPISVMHFSRTHVSIVVAVLLSVVQGGISPSAAADLRLATIFGDHAVLQRDRPVPIWGWGEPGAEVVVTFGDQEKAARADADGRWKVTLDPMAASNEPRDLAVRANDSVTVRGVLVGEVWLASGQSNMEYGLSHAVGGAAAIAAAEDPQLRFFKVEHRTAALPEADVAGTWQRSASENKRGWSAVAYCFARDLRKQLGCPVAVIQAGWGGTMADTWMSIDALRQEPPFSHSVAAYEKALARHRELEQQPEIGRQYATDIARWHSEIIPAYVAAKRAYDAARAAGQDPGPPPQTAVPEPQNPDPTGIPSPSRRPGAATITYNAMIAPLAPYAIRGVIWYQGEGNGGAGLEYRTLLPRLIADWRGLWGDGLPFLFVQLPGFESETMKRQTEPAWAWLREAQLFSLSVQRTAMAVAIDVGDPRDVHPPAKCEIGMRLALAARKVAYGEDVVSSGPLYRDAEFADGVARIRFTETGGGLAVGRAPWLPAHLEPLPDDRLVGFALAGEDRVWVEAEARIDGDTVVVSSPRVPRPVAVRYGWANAPRCNLANVDGLPASPFRSDDWPAVEAPR